MLRLCVLGSGSSGNAIYIASETTPVLIDAGLTCRQTTLRMENMGGRLEDLRAVCLSHEHDDHAAGIPVIYRRHPVPLYANTGTLEVLKKHPKLGKLKWNVFETGQSFPVGDLVIEAFSVSHDAYEPVGFVISNGQARIGVVTDVGTPTALIKARLRRCQAIVIEANHDEHMLQQDARRPWILKQRIRGRQGHLSNDQAAAILSEIAGPELQHVFLAHLSSECNRGDLALACIRRALDEAGQSHVKVSLTYPDRASDLWSSG